MLVWGCPIAGIGDGGGIGVVSEVSTRSVTACLQTFDRCKYPSSRRRGHGIVDSEFCDFSLKITGSSELAVQARPCCLAITLATHTQSRWHTLAMVGPHQNMPTPRAYAQVPSIRFDSHLSNIPCHSPSHPTPSPSSDLPSSLPLPLPLPFHRTHCPQTTRSRCPATDRPQTRGLRPRLMRG